MSLLAQAGDPEFLRGFDTFVWAVGLGLAAACGLLCLLGVLLVRYLRRQRCDHCRAANEAAARYCGRCGKLLPRWRAA